MTRLHSDGRFRVLTIALLLCVFAVRMIVPQGYMWATAADGSSQVVICSGFGTPPALTPLAASALAAQHESDRRDQNGKVADHPCAFAAASTAVDLAGEVHPAPAQARFNEAPTPLHPFRRPGRGLAAPPPPKTGPPAFA